MQPGEPRLAIDYGTVSTVAVLAWPDGRWLPLTFDGGPVLSSAVRVTPVGDVVTGQDAWRHAVTAPDGFVPAPLRAGTGSVVLNGTELAVQALVAATLRRVAAEATRVAGMSVTDVRMVVPAGWGPRRRTWLRQAAHQAGLGQPRLVEAPIAAADHVLACGVQVPVGAFLLIADAGAGFEVTLLRRGPAGFEVLSTLADADAGGYRIDDLLTAWMLGQGHGEPVAGSTPVPNHAGGSAGGRDGAWWAVMASTRIAKEALSQQVAVTVPLPAPAPAVILASATVEDLARPALKRAAELTAEAITAAEITTQQVTGIYCIGAGTTMPTVAQSLGEQVAMVPVVVPEPGMAAVLGAVEAGAARTPTDAPPSPLPPVPPLRRAAALLVPGLASFALLAHFLFSASYSVGGRTYRSPHFYVTANWGELTLAAALALVTCLAGGSLLGTLLARAEQSRPDRRAQQPSAEAQVGTGILAAAAVGVAIAGLYAVFTALYFGVDITAPLRWALYPLAPIAAVALVVAVIAARRVRTPVQGWDAYLAFPLSSVIAAAAGMLLLQYAMSTERPPNLETVIDLTGRLGGLLIGVAAATALARTLVVRLLIAAPLGLFLAAIVSWPATGVIAVIYTVAVTLWWARRLWDLIRNPTGHRMTSANPAVPQVARGWTGTEGR